MESLTTPLRIATRGSDLALWQANFVRTELLRHFPDLPIELEVVVSKGDVQQDRPLYELGGVGLFTKEVQEAVLTGEADLAVHSLKDLPTVSHADLCLAAVPPRGPVEDILIAPDHRTLGSLPPGSRVATSSLRRRAQLLYHRPDLVIENIRGNVETRIRKVREENLDGLILARAGLVRLGLEEEISEVLPPETILPAVGQGALGIECRAGDAPVRERLALLDDPATRSAVDAERALLRTIEGGCQVPLGVLSRLTGDRLSLRAIVLSPDGRRHLEATLEESARDAESLGCRLAEILLSRGAAELVQAPPPKDD